MFIHSSTDDYSSYIYEDTGSPFIEQLVTVLRESLKNQHLEDALLKVKEKVAEKLIEVGGDWYKQMPSVVSQMRYQVWWVE